MNSHLTEFVKDQKTRLEALRDELLENLEQAEGQTEDTAREHDDVRDSGEEAAIEARRDREIGVVAEVERRLANVRLALYKIQVGNYGYSDETGEPIPKDRLEAIPEARYTVEEEEQRES